MNNLSVITYTNKKCADVWTIYYDLLNKYFTSNIAHYMINDVNYQMPSYKSFTVEIYNPTDPFYLPWIKLLPTLKTKYFLYMQEDFFLYKNVDIKLLEYYLDVLEENESISCIRLLKSGILSNINIENINTLYYVDYNVDYAFSMQPSIWRINDFLKLQNTRLQISPWDEPNLNGHVLDKLNITSLYHYNNENKRGMSHYDSNIFPYIATALVKGKWNTKEYPELYEILNSYNIDVSIRGEFK